LSWVDAVELRDNSVVWLVKEFEMEGISKLGGEALDPRTKEVEVFASFGQLVEDLIEQGRAVVSLAGRAKLVELVYDKKVHTFYLSTV
jgi:hypothetical protein